MPCRLTAREGRALAELETATASLFLAPVASITEARLKLAVLIAAGEAGPPEALAFPWAYLRTLLVDLALNEAPSAGARR